MLGIRLGGHLKLTSLAWVMAADETARDTARTGHVVVVDDDEDMRFIVGAALNAQGFSVTQLSETDPNIGELENIGADLVILDIEMGVVNGLSVLENLRERSDLPVILVTSRGAEEDRVAGLDLGADDYVVKPFLPRELVSRVRAVLRRMQPVAAAQDKMEFRGLVIDTRRREVTLGGDVLKLTKLEFSLLVTLASNPGETLSRARLLQDVWNSEPEWQDPETVTEHVRRLRAKIEPDVAGHKYIETVRGVGYRFEP